MIRLCTINVPKFMHDGLVVESGWSEFDPETAEPKTRAALVDHHGWFVRVHPDDVGELAEHGFEMVDGVLVDHERMGGSSLALEPEIRDDGPTIEEFVKAGCAPENYPPQGYREKKSPGLTKFRKEQAKAKASEPLVIDEAKFLGDNAKKDA